MAVYTMCECIYLFKYLLTYILVLSLYHSIVESHDRQLPEEIWEIEDFGILRQLKKNTKNFSKFFFPVYIHSSDLLMCKNVISNSDCPCDRPDYIQVNTCKTRSSEGHRHLHFVNFYDRDLLHTYHPLSFASNGLVHSASLHLSLYKHFYFII